MIIRLIISFSFILLFSCGNPASNETIANELLDEIRCPNYNEWFGSLKVCANTVEFDGTISYTLEIAEKELVHFEKEFPDPSLMLKFLEISYCEGIAGSLGIDWPAIAGAQIGIIQRVMDANGIYDNNEIYKNFPKNVELKYEVSTKNNIYKITRKPTAASLLIEDICDIVIDPIDTNGSSI